MAIFGGKKTTNKEVGDSSPQATEARPRVLRLGERMSLMLARFDIDDKEDLAKQLVEMLELKPSESLLEKGRMVLGADITKVEGFRLEILAQIAKDRNFTEPEDPFPDDFGAPKAGF
ncbi:MAG TPA: hypothetical protein VF179_24160 [Thermoanaerobaculia bacterium]|nr:hypothetical protein [Thermoanaerobaculia bacterium]